MMRPIIGIAFLAVPGLGDDAEKIRHNGMHHCAFSIRPAFADLMITLIVYAGCGHSASVSASTTG